jgi:Fe-S-cluster containining protein
MGDREDRDLQAGLRLIHEQLDGTHRDTGNLTKDLFALLEVLVDKGVVTLEELASKRLPIAKQIDEEQRLERTVDLGSEADKYDLGALPDIDCPSRLHLCKAKCCSFRFALTAQDLEEGVVKWTLAQPYKIRQDADGWCTHMDRGTKGCGVYEYRPAPCRIYDCRRDDRVWLDFDKRIPAKDL